MSALATVVHIVTLGQAMKATKTDVLRNRCTQKTSVLMKFLYMMHKWQQSAVRVVSPSLGESYKFLEIVEISIDRLDANATIYDQDERDGAFNGFQFKFGDSRMCESCATCGSLQDVERTTPNDPPQCADCFDNELAQIVRESLKPGFRYNGRRSVVRVVGMTYAIVETAINNGTKRTERVVRHVKLSDIYGSLTARPDTLPHVWGIIPRDVWGAVRVYARKVDAMRSVFLSDERADIERFPIN